MSDLSCDILRTKHLVCFGDSVTQGVPHAQPGDVFPAVLERRLNARFAPQLSVCATNAGVGGETSKEGLARIQPDVLAHRPDLVTVEFGLNDIRYEPEKRVYEDQFAENLRQIYRILTEAGARVIFMTPTPIVVMYHVYSKIGTHYYDKWGDCDGANRAYAEIIRQVAAELDAPLCDIYASFIEEAIKAEFRGETFDYTDLSVLSRYISSRDGVHPTAAGQELIAMQLYRVIVEQDLLATHM